MVYRKAKALSSLEIFRYAGDCLHTISGTRSCQMPVAEMIKRFKYSNKLKEVGNKAFISRCSFSSSEGEETCDRYEVDHIERSPITNAETLEKIFIVKYYYYSGQLDFQIFPDLKFIENNGRGVIQYGKCQ